MYDVAWSPTHPALFATVDGTGRLDLWNLNNDTEVSTASVSVDGSPAALNRVSWTPSGLHVTAGDDAGELHILRNGHNELEGGEGGLVTKLHYVITFIRRQNMGI